MTASVFDCNPDLPFALYQGRIVRRGQLWADVRQLAAQLPDHRYVFNLCENRYRFCVGLLAAASRGQISLLPPSKQIAVIHELQQDYRDAYLLADTHLTDAVLPVFYPDLVESAQPATAPEFDWQQPLIVAFTSGSTGQPKACAHSPTTFLRSAQAAVQQLQFANQQWLMLTTTPPQHMFGLETSVFWPLCSSLILHDGRPFFAADIAQALHNSPWPAVLVSTPTHLQALVKTVHDWPPLAGVLSATDVLPKSLARQIKNRFGQAPQEIYGSTETLSFASRNSLSQRHWQPYSQNRISRDAKGQITLHSAHLPEPVILADRLRITADGRFVALGRDRDVIKIAGKRSALSELNRRLNAIDGVEDGFCWLHEQRMMAVVTGTADKTAIRAGLAAFIDPVFMPRRIYHVAQISRTATGKLSHAVQQKLVAELLAEN